jgi:FtsH-binding integral membrane protein
METLSPLIPVLTGLVLLGVGLFGALTRRRLDVLPSGFYVAGLGIAILAAGLGDLGNARLAGVHVARCALGIATAQAIVFLVLARLAATRLRATRADDLERLRG